MKTFYLILIGILCTQIHLNAQNKTFAFRIAFKHKNSDLTFADSNIILSNKALLRRHKHSLKLDSLDLPIRKSYIDSAVAAVNGFKVKNKSKWLNQIVVLTKDSNLTNLINLPFVKSVKLVGRYPNGWLQNPNTPNKNDVVIQHTKSKRGSASYYGYAYEQIKQTNTDYLHDLGYKGEQMHIAIFDIAFGKLDSLRQFDSLTKYSTRIIDKYNFAKDTVNISQPPFAYSHGCDVLGTMAGNVSGEYVGSAPYANYSMFITEEYAWENPNEEDNWLSAAERADSSGADIITSSLGYANFDNDFAGDSYNYATHLNGSTSQFARAANLAVSKGIFVCNSIGNSGKDPIKYLFTPSDGDSVYAVGSVDSTGKFNAIPNYSSSFGPNNNGQIKPDGVGVGLNVWLVGNDGIYARTNGSSFSCPLLAGGIACLMQALPNVNAWTLRRLIHQSSSTFATPSDSMGYGIPNFKIALQNGLLLNNSNINLSTKKIDLYPNPANNLLFINNWDGYNYEILNINGQVITSGILSKAINIESLIKGAYYLRLHNEKYLATKAFMKQ
jgi:serine protease AprX